MLPVTFANQPVDPASEADGQSLTLSIIRPRTFAQPAGYSLPMPHRQPYREVPPPSASLPVWLAMYDLPCARG